MAHSLPRKSTRGKRIALLPNQEETARPKRIVGKRSGVIGTLPAPAGRTQHASALFRSLRLPRNFENYFFSDFAAAFRASCDFSRAALFLWIRCLAAA